MFHFTLSEVIPGGQVGVTLLQNYDISLPEMSVNFGMSTTLNF